MRRMTWLAAVAVFTLAACGGEDSGSDAEMAAANPCAANPCAANPCAGMDLPVDADTGLAVDRGASSLQSNQQGGDGEQRQGEHQEQGPEQEVEQAAHRVPSAFSQVPGLPWRARSHSPRAMEAVVIR